MDEDNMDEVKNGEKPATISVFAYESALMHKEAEAERNLRIVRIVRSICFMLCFTLMFVVSMLVVNYSSRTRMWNETITKLTSTLAEVTNGVYQQSDP